MSERGNIDRLGTIARALANDNAVAIVGAGVSRSGVSGGPGKEGLPTAGAFVEYLRKSLDKSYITDSMTFGEATFQVRQREGRAALLSILDETYNRSDVGPGQAHYLLAQLPFAAYVSFNFDTLLEKALDRANRRHHPILEDHDVPMTANDHVPVFKPHGCTSRRNTIRAAIDDTIDPQHELPLLFAMLNTVIAQRYVVYLGFSLRDIDFMRLHLGVVKQLGDMMPTAIAVVHSASEHERQYWKEQKVEIVQEDVVQFLAKLAAYRELRDTTASDGSLVDVDPWLEDEFFRKLLRIRSLPTETQVIDAMLEHVMEIVTDGDVETLPTRIAAAIERVLEYRQNYAAFAKVGEEIKLIITDHLEKRDLETTLRKYMKSRREVGDKLSQNAAERIHANDKILVYSQSKRVLDALMAVPKVDQNQCHLYVTECRPKSPTSFQDGHAFYSDVVRNGGSYTMHLIPDIVIGSLMERKEITKVIMGAHQLCKIDGKLEYVVNTSGSLMICNVAAKYGISVIFVAESDKLVTLQDDKGLNLITLKEEENLTRGVMQELRRLGNVASGLKVTNYGYDIVPIEAHIEVVTEQ